jgi:hypothetical protein
MASCSRDAALRAAWVACGERCDYRDWTMAFDGWEVHPVIVDGKVVGAGLAKGNEIHIAVLPEHHRKWCTPGMWRVMVADRLKKYGQLFTSGKSDNEFIRRAGFRPVNEINGLMLFVRE